VARNAQNTLSASTLPAARAANRGVDAVILCDWLPPDFGAVGQYTLIRARERAKSGERVVLIGLSSRSGSVETESFASGELTVVRLAARTYDRASFAQRAWWTLRTDLALVAKALRYARGCRELMFTGSPPFLLHLVAPLNVLARKRLVYRITDFFPECLMAELGRTPWALALFYRLTLFWRRRVDLFEVLGEDQRARLVDCGVAPARITLRRDPAPVAIDRSTRPLARSRALAGSRVLLYSGNFGAAHDHETFLEGYARHHRLGSARVRLWLNAQGARAETLYAELKARGLPCHRTRPVPLEALARLLVTPDAHLITLRPPFAGYVLPSKVYGCIASGKPILFVGPRESDVHLLCRSSGVAYRHADVGDAEAVFRALESL
jgi:hypothetical protein